RAQAGVAAVQVVDELAEGGAGPLDCLGAIGQIAHDGGDADLGGHGLSLLSGWGLPPVDNGARTPVIPPRVSTRRRPRPVPRRPPRRGCGRTGTRWRPGPPPGRGWRPAR